MIEIGDEDSDEYSFKIKNSSVEERHLLFKVRRSERKMVDFEPKQGVVAPGSTLKVRLWVCDRCIHSSRLLVKLVSLKSAYMTEDFLQSWEIATKRGGEVKKVIDLKRTRAKEDSMQQLLEHSSLLVDTKISEVSNPHRQMISLNSAKKTMENLSPSSSLASISDMDSYTNPVEEAIQSLKQRLLHQSSQIFSGRHNSIEDHTHTCEVASHKNSQQGTGHKRTGSADNSEMDLSTSFEFPPSISTFASESKKSTKHIDAKNDTNFALSTILQKLQLSEDFIKPVLAEISDDARYDERSILAGIALALQNFSMVSSLSPTFPDKMTNSGLIQNRTLVSERISPGKKESITTFHRPVNARLIALGSSKYPEKEKNNDHFGSAGVVIEISGSPYRLDNGSVLDIDDLEESNEEEGLAPLTKSLLRETLQNLIIESNSQRKRVAAVQVEHAQISSISDCFSNLFACDKSQSQIEEKLNSMRALYLEDNLKHISLNSSPLMVGIDCSINKFRSLLTLNLSGNKIAKIEGPLDLPSLHLLDISHNNFASFDYLQLLINLRTLVASYNKIHSLHMSVNMLVSLSRTLTSLDLSHNPVHISQIPVALS